MKKFDFLMICLLFSFTSYSQTNEDIAKAETKKMISELNLKAEQYEDLYNANLMAITTSNDVKKSQISEDEKTTNILKIEERKTQLFKEILTSEQFLTYEENVKLAANPKNESTPETAEDLASKETAILTSELKLNREQVSPVYTIILGMTQKNLAAQNSEITTEEKEFILIRSQEAKKTMLKEVLSTEQFSAYEKYFLAQVKINSEKAIVVPQKKKIVSEEPVMLDKAIE
jgi:hypothetical protein